MVDKLPGGGAPPLDVERLRRDEFPWANAGDVTYLNAASTGPLPERTVRAMDAFTRKRAAPHRLSFEEQFGALTTCRTLLAQLVNAPAEQIALAGNTSTGLNLAAWGLPLGPGDVVVVSDREFPANVYPWQAAARDHGYSVRLVPTRADGLLDEDALIDALDEPGVRVLAASWVGFATGAVLDLARVGAACRARGVLFVLDAIQGLGALTIDLAATPVDIMACGAQKWLLSPWGTGFTYVAPGVMDRITVQPVSWMGVRGSDDFSRLLQYDLAWRDDARRFEQVTLPHQDFAGLAASLELIHDLGAAAVAAHIHRGTDALLEGAAARGVPLVTPRARHAGIAALRPDDATGTSARLTAAGVIHSLREGTVRLAPHVYTSDGEIERALRHLAS